MRIQDGQPEQHPTPLAIDISATPATARPTAVAGQLTPADQGGVLADISGVDFTADAAAAMASGMAADADRRGRYLAAMQPLGGGAGDLMPVSSPPLDPGAAPGEAEPWGALYDPPRGY
jgi:hypothetical protein